jgi:hypothetical protein
MRATLSHKGRGSTERAAAFAFTRKLRLKFSNSQTVIAIASEAIQSSAKQVWIASSLRFSQ